jgi:hypothetical protein
MRTVRDDDATMGPVLTMTVRDDGATIACPVCHVRFVPEGRKKFCGTPCRQAAWRAQRAAPIEPVIAKSDTVYACDGCGTRYLGEQRCDECNSWCRKLGPGGSCPECDAAVAVSDLFTPEQLAGTRPAAKIRRR